MGFGLQYDVGRDEIGLALTLSWLPPNRSSGRPELTPNITRELLSVIEGAVTSQSKGRRAPRLRWYDAIVRQVGSSQPPQVTIVVKREDGNIDESLGDVVLGLVERAIGQEKLIIECPSEATGHVGTSIARVASAALTLPRVVPREIPRAHVLRLGRLGSGVEAVVWRAQVLDRTRQTPPMQVALKEPREGSGVMRDDIEREAAMMALLQHDNVIRLVGVVTIPRSMPAVVIVEYCELGAVDEHLRKQPGAAPMVLRLSFCADIAAGLGYLASRRMVHRDVAARNVSTCLPLCSGMLWTPASTYIRLPCSIDV